MKRERIIAGAYIISLAAIAYSVVRMFSIQPDIPATHQTYAAQSAETPGSRAKIIAGIRTYHPPAVVEEPIAPPVAKPAPRPDVLLTGIWFYKEKKYLSRAFIDSQNGDGAFGEGDLISPGLLLVSIAPVSVIVSHGGANSEVALAGPDGQGLIVPVETDGI